MTVSKKATPTTNVAHSWWHSL